MLFKISRFQSAKKQGSIVHTKEKKEVSRNCSFKSAVTSISKELKEAMRLLW